MNSILKSRGCPRRALRCAIEIHESELSVQEFSMCNTYMIHISYMYAVRSVSKGKMGFTFCTTICNEEEDAY